MNFIVFSLLLCFVQLSQATPLDTKIRKLMEADGSISAIVKMSHDIFTNAKMSKNAEVDKFLQDKNPAGLSTAQIEFTSAVLKKHYTEADIDYLLKLYTSSIGGKILAVNKELQSRMSEGPLYQINFQVTKLLQPKSK
jgi:hypothetical protein